VGRGGIATVIVSVCERTNAGTWSQATIDFKLKQWRRDPFGAAFEEMGCPIGSMSRARMSRLMCLHPDICLNLLPPSATLGDWDNVAAQQMAELIVPWCALNGHSLMLMGRRVLRAFGKQGAIFGERLEWTSDTTVVHGLALPHPGGRSRYLNDPKRRVEVKTWVAEFSAAVNGREVKS